MENGEIGFNSWILILGLKYMKLVNITDDQNYESELVNGKFHDSSVEIMCHVILL